MQRDEQQENERLSTHHKVVAFPPNAWHTVEPWTGERITLSAYSVRSGHELTEEETAAVEKVWFFRSLVGTTLLLSREGRMLLMRRSRKHGQVRNNLPVLPEGEQRLISKFTCCTQQQGMAA